MVAKEVNWNFFNDITMKITVIEIERSSRHDNYDGPTSQKGTTVAIKPKKCLTNNNMQNKNNSSKGKYIKQRASQKWIRKTKLAS